MSGRRRLLVVSIFALGVLAGPGAAQAHPLGNFTINTAAQLLVRTDEVLVDYAVDMAEIPTLQEQRALDLDGDGTRSAQELAAYSAGVCEDLRDGLDLRIDGAAAPPSVRSAQLSFPAGQAGLATLRLRCLFASPIGRASAHELLFDDGNYRDRIGWREVTAVGDGATILGSDVPGESPSDRLRSYPSGVAPSHMVTASLTFRPGGASLDAQPDRAVLEPASGGLLVGFAARADLSAGLIVLMIVIAVGVGAVHALGPGHGKSLIGAYLVGADGTLRQAAAVGAAVSVMHTASVLGLGLLVLSAERIFAPERVYPWLGLASGLVALGLGAALLVSRIHALSERRWHGHDHSHVHRPLSRKGVVALAIAGGILPSPSALVVLLGSVSIGRTGLGLVLIAAFSAGLAASLVAVGAVAIRARHVVARRLPARAVLAAPLISAGGIVVIGVVLTAHGLLQL